MNKNNDIQDHYYTGTADNVLYMQGKPLLPIDPHFPFVLTRFEVMSSRGQADYPHRHDYYEILYVCDGQGTHIIDFEPYPVEPPVFHFLSKGQIHFWQLTKPLVGFALLIPEEFLSFTTSDILRAHDLTFFQNVGHAPYLFVGSEHTRMINGLIEGMEHEYNDEGARSVTVLRAYLHILFTQLSRLYALEHPSGNSQETSSLVRQFHQLVEENFLTFQSVDDYANKIGISTGHLRDSVKEVTGRSPGHIIREKIVLEAKRFLVHSNIPVAEIGYRLNFEDSSYFGRFFRRETGMSPRTFRQKIRDQYHISPQ